MPATATFSGVPFEVGELAGGPGDVAELGDVRPRRAVEQQQQRHDDADEQPGQGVEEQHAEQRGHGGDEVGPGGVAVDAPEPPGVERGRSRRRAAMSTSSTTAAITTAASVASGRSSNRPVRNSSVMTVSTATTSPDSCERAPAEPFTAVFDRLPLTTMPLAQPRPEVGRAEADQLAVGVDLVVRPAWRRSSPRRDPRRSRRA